MKYWGKDIRDALHGDGPLAIPVLRRKGVAAVVVGLGVVGHALARAGLVVLNALRTTLLGLKAITWGIWWFYAICAGIGAAVMFIYYMLCFLIGPATGMPGPEPHHGIGVAMAAGAGLAVLYAIGKATK